jgi:hypothetical protein
LVRERSTVQSCPAAPSFQGLSLSRQNQHPRNVRGISFTRGPCRGPSAPRSHRQRLTLRHRRAQDGCSDAALRPAPAGFHRRGPVEAYFGRQAKRRRCWKSRPSRRILRVPRQASFTIAEQRPAQLSAATRQPRQRSCARSRGLPPGNGWIDRIFWGEEIAHVLHPRRLEQPRHLLRAQDHRQPARLADERQSGDELRPTQRHRKRKRSAVTL